MHNVASWRSTDLRLLAFGFLLTFLSSFGQTFFIGLFSEELRAASGLNHGAFGTVYSAATLASAVCMFWAGALIDRTTLRSYVTAAALLLTAGCILLITAEDVLWLAAAFFLLRFAGQGLLTHSAVTSAVRFFERARGKALAIVLLGHPAGEAVLPLMAVLIAASAGWRSVWMLAAAVLVIAIPGVAHFCARSISGPAKGIERSSTVHVTRTQPVDASRGEVLRDRRFHFLLPTLLLPGFVLTGVFIHQRHLVDEKGWELSWFAASFMAFAGAQVVGTLSSGPLIDRFTARRLAPFYLLPLGAACIAINMTDDRLVAIPFMIGAGLTLGMAASIVTVLLAEIYGVTHLGAIRALAVSTMIMSTALAPAIFGWLLEFDVGFGSILAVCSVGVAAGAVLARIALRPAPRPGSH